ncbi:CopG family transcriptional regulator [uncultured Thiodictyon sp.]|jgi:hypothetical protein|uniref:ribbon-helix-helix domain-containing protein n=1 Tax=uncultured Thiodictyon sp. TaxID=1846217 RepID=UPI0025CD2D3F|nr:CopG family transcriptional regulator [uncultured Thiodictyon sp.]
MTLSVQIDPLLETRVEEEARRLGVSPSDFVQDVLEQALGLKSPADIYRRVCSFTPMGDPDASENVADKVTARLRAHYPG